MRQGRGRPAIYRNHPTGMNGSRKVHIKSFGCQMNVYDSHRMADTLARLPVAPFLFLPKSAKTSQGACALG